MRKFDAKNVIRCKITKTLSPVATATVAIGADNSAADSLELAVEELLELADGSDTPGDVGVGPDFGPSPSACHSKSGACAAIRCCDSVNTLSNAVAAQHAQQNKNKLFHTTDTSAN